MILITIFAAFSLLGFWLGGRCRAGDIRIAIGAVSISALSFCALAQTPGPGEIPPPTVEPAPATVEPAPAPLAGNAQIVWTGRASWAAQSLAQRRNFTYTAIGNYAAITVRIDRPGGGFVPGSGLWCLCILTVSAKDGTFVWTCPCAQPTGYLGCTINSSGCQGLS